MPDGLLDDGRFYRIEKTCGVCKRTERLAAWNRIATELGVAMTLGRSGRTTTFTCPSCASKGSRHP